MCAAPLVTGDEGALPSELFRHDVDNLLDTLRGAHTTQAVVALTQFGRHMFGTVAYAALPERDVSLLLFGDRDTQLGGEGDAGSLCAVCGRVAGLRRKLLPEASVAVRLLAALVVNRVQFYVAMRRASLEQVMTMRLGKHFKHGTHPQRVAAFRVARVLYERHPEWLSDMLGEEHKREKTARRVFLQLMADNARGMLDDVPAIPPPVPRRRADDNVQMLYGERSGGGGGNGGASSSQQQQQQQPAGGSGALSDAEVQAGAVALPVTTADRHVVRLRHQLPQLRYCAGMLSDVVRSTYTAHRDAGDPEPFLAPPPPQAAAASAQDAWQSGMMVTVPDVSNSFMGVPDSRHYELAATMDADYFDRLLSDTLAKASALSVEMNDAHRQLRDLTRTVDETAQQTKTNVAEQVQVSEALLQHLLRARTAGGGGGSGAAVARSVSPLPASGADGFAAGPSPVSAAM